MAVSEPETLNCNLVLLGMNLLNNPADFQSFQSAVETEVIGSDVIELRLRQFNLQRDRISLQLTPSRSVIQRDYPAKEDLDRLAEIASCSIACSSNRGELQAHGYNVEMVFDQDSEPTALNYLARKMFSPSIYPQWTLSGGSCKLNFRDEKVDNRVWNVTLEPRHNDANTTKVFISLNMHLEQPEVPPKDAIKTNLEEAWEITNRFIGQLERRE